MLELESQFASLPTHEPVVGEVFFEIIKQPKTLDRNCNYLQATISDLKRTMFYSAPAKDTPSYYLIPLNEEDEQNIEFASSLYRGWNNETLRKGYLPSTPTKLTRILDDIRAWVREEDTVLYAIRCEGEVNCIGYICARFQTLIPSVEISYGTTNPDLVRKGHMTRATAVLIRGLSKYPMGNGMGVKQIQAEASSKNIGSLRVLKNNGFIFDGSRSSTESPITMGGTDIPVVLNL